MADRDELNAILDRIEAQTQSDEDLAVLRRLFAAHHLTLATGTRAIAAGGSISDAVIVTGDDSVVRVIKGPTAGVIQQALHQTMESIAADRRRDALSPYLEAVHQYCDTLPYATLARRRVPLVDVYVEQEIEEQRPPDQRIAEPRSPGPAPPSQGETIDQVLAQHRHVLLEGEPGAGKSTLLNHLALTLIDARAAGQTTLVPVPVLARGLAFRRESFGASLRTQVTHQLAQYLRAELPSDLFEHPPAPNGDWLVLVDGLDEVVGQAERDDLVRWLTDQAADPAAPYRFVVATRPLDEARIFRSSLFGRYRLRPIEPGQVRTFAELWFTSGGVLGKDEVEQFVRQVEDSRIADLAQVPLLLTMVAIIYEEDRRKQKQDRTTQLPARRAALYRRFVSLLLLDEERARGIWAAFRAEWERLPRGEDYAKELFDGRQDLLEHLALWRQQGEAGTLVEEALRYARGRGWLPEHESEWLGDQLETLLRRTGLIVQRGDDVTFIHDTFREYLAACALAKYYAPSDRRAWDYIRHWKDRGWSEVVLFLLGIWREEHVVSRWLERIMASRGLGRFMGKVDVDGVFFAARALADGAKMTSTFQHKIVSRLLDVAHDQSKFYLGLGAVSALGKLGQGEALLELARDTRVDSWVRQEAADELGKLGQGEALLELARDTRMNSWLRLEAARELGKLGQGEAAVPILLELARDPGVVPWLRLEAARKLGKLGQGEALLELARDPGVVPKVRLETADELGRLGQGEAASQGSIPFLNPPP